MKTRFTLPGIVAILFFIIALSSCEEDFNTIGADVIGDHIDDAELFDASTVVSYSRKLLPVQTNGLPAYQLGVYNDPVYGKSTVNLLSQLFMNVSDPNFGYNTVLDSVTLYIPFFNELNITDSDSVYTVDSIYGNQPINISIYESNYFLRDLDPDSNFEEPQKYYSNQGPLFEGFLGELLLTIEDFVPSDEPIELTTTVLDTVTGILDTLKVKIPPGLRVQLPTEFFKEKIINMDGTLELLNNNNFKEYFRGLYFDVESTGPNGNLFLFNTENANITLHYTYNTLPLSIDGTEDPDNEELEGTFSFLFCRNQCKYL